MEVHLHYLQPETYQIENAARVFQGRPNNQKNLGLAKKLKQIYDGKGLWVNLQLIPDRENYTDSISGNAIFVPYPEELPRIYLEKINEQWYYADETARAIPEIHREIYPFGSDLLINLFPKFEGKEVLGLAIWQYVGLLLVLLIGTIVYLALSRLLRPIINRLTSTKLFPQLVSPSKINSISRLFSVLVTIRLLKVFLPILQLPIDSSFFAVTSIKMITTVLIVLILLQILSIIVQYFDRLTKRTESKMDEQLLPIVERGFQTLIVIGGTIQVFKMLNIDITALIAGLSIGGLAIALAAQDTVKNLFGSMTIFFDKPFQIGDWINFDGVDGTVEEVGFRSTRVRTFANSLVYVPNGKLADMIINNYGLRVYRRYSTKIGVTYDTTPEQLESFVEKLREMVLAHPNTRKDAFEVHLNELGAYSIDILFYIFFEVGTWKEELAARQEVLLKVIRIAKELNISFAFPTTSIHLESGALER